MKKKQKELAEKALKLMAKIDKLKSLYEKLDEVTLELREIGFQSYPCDRGILFLADNFAHKNAVFRTTSVRRFELKFEKSK